MGTKVLVFILVMTASISLRGQDGSDILYGPVNRLDESYLRDFVHLDFYSRSFRGTSVDTITIILNNKPILFKEHRQGNGYDNWFSQQFLVSCEKVDGLTIRIAKSRLDSITSKSIFVTNFVEYYENDKILPDRSTEAASEFSKKIIAEVLVSEASHKKKKK